MDLRIPPGLGELLRDFTVEVLKEKPEQLVDFAADYFTKMQKSAKPKTVPMYIIVDSDEEAGEPDPVLVKPISGKNKQYARRTSVSAERYDPEADDDNEEKVVHTKTEAQKARLHQAIAPILLFKSLDSEQVRAVKHSWCSRHVVMYSFSLRYVCLGGIDMILQ
jgi:cAMP-dependent protein kinase regulator